MNKKTLRVLEYDKVIAQLLNYVYSELGESLVKQLAPADNLNYINQLQQQTDEATMIYSKKGQVPLTPMFDIRPLAQRSLIQSTLAATELVKIKKTVMTSRHFSRFYEQLIQDNEIMLNELTTLYHQMPNLHEVSDYIQNICDDSGLILDHASEVLARIRSSIRLNEQRVREKIEHILRSGKNQKKLSDILMTIRNDRLVIPVKQEYKHDFPGVVHDQSASGQTLYIEPQSVVESNNKLKTLKNQEYEEIEKILIEATQFIANYSEELIILTDILGQFDFIFAKARYGLQMKGSRPKLVDTGYLNLKKAKHPFINPKDVVANTITLGDDYQTIVITGPNTGGKTVTLKTVGLLSLMAQSGLQIPVMEGSTLTIFKKIFCDIGDEQSIAQNLSTFSSHMMNIIDIVKQADQHSLVLLDELGSGTDPQEGAALAISLLDQLHHQQAIIIATTHYPELKAYSYNRDWVMNASVEFDVQALKPTYRLLMGVPGKSNAFDISQRLGLNINIIANARQLVDEGSQDINNMISGLERATIQAEKQEQEAREYVKSAKKLHQDLQQYMIDYYEYKDKMYEQAKKEANQKIRASQQEAQEIIQYLRDLRDSKMIDIKDHELIEAKRQLDHTLLEETIIKPKINTNKKQVNYVIGDDVKVVTYGQKGTIVDINKKTGQYIVKVGIMKMNVDKDELEKVVQDNKGKVQVATRKVTSAPVKLELDLRGERYDSAINLLDKYLDEALLAGYHQVTIIHGKGTGALQKGVQNFLKTHRHVASFRGGVPSEGGFGVTVVEFK